MRGFLLASACLVPCLAACAPNTASAPAAPAATPAQTTAVTEPAAAPGAPAPAEAPKPQASNPQPKPQPAGASIGGAIRDGNRPSPALRVCAYPVDGGAPTCIESAAGANAYRIEVAPGRYFLMGWVQGGELTLIAHATQIRCIRAPCPPDELIEIDVAAGETKTGIDLSGGYVDVPQGWPRAPG